MSPEKKDVSLNPTETLSVKEEPTNTDTQGATSPVDPEGGSGMVEVSDKITRQQEVLSGSGQAPEEPVNEQPPNQDWRQKLDELVVKFTTFNTMSRVKDYDDKSSAYFGEFVSAYYEINKFLKTLPLFKKEDGRLFITPPEIFAGGVSADTGTSLAGHRIESIEILKFYKELINS